MSNANIFPRLPDSSVQAGIPTLSLYDGLKLVGEKKWRQARQDYEAEIKFIDRETDRLYGLLTIKRFDKALKVTHFEGEIIGKKHSFLTRRWNADAAIDRKHWWKFDCFFKFASINTEDFDYSCLHGDDHIFMRWKETKCEGGVYCAAPGFYYVCLTKSTGDCEGIYYDKNCCEEWSQDTFTLKQKPQRSFPVFQFR